ncbi:hypothetical protein JD276_08985 [Leucobacter sp. CSA1]|uniref:Uncharacterized protein n=1 Tax=Leucobacter chromiisoli TaxID=2796471 RepID=A0A934UV78_9MICO|nr:hypothetical protein [Leucobacter chromiisoli]MBK0419166.1 hypothetical protein [Leucobacter chromiisoli]
MRIREITVLQAWAPAPEQEAAQASVLDAIDELDAQYAAGEIERAAYFIKKRAFVRML